MRVAVLGLGSIGQRHAAILQTLGHEVRGFDPNDGAPTPEGALRAGSEQEALSHADAAVVACPPSEHLRQARLALEAGAHTLVEKPVAPQARGVSAIDLLARERGLVLRAAMNLRFHPGVRTTRRLIEQGAVGRPLRASVWCGSWLPGWRAERDYRETYSAQRQLGGGVLLDAIHELDYAVWMLGPITRVCGMLAHESSLTLDVEDVAALVMEHSSGTVTSVTLDYLDRSYHRGCRVVGEEGTIEWSWQEEAVVLHTAQGSPRRLEAKSDVSPTYRAQMEAFLDEARGEAPGRRDMSLSTMGEAAQVLALADAARTASDSGAAVEVAPAGLALRPAAAGDAERLLRWRNDPQTRRASFNEEPISQDEHEIWLAHTLAHPDRRLLIAIEDGEPIGQLRLDRLRERAAEVHVTLAPEARGHGLAVALLRIVATEQAPAFGAGRLLARIKPGNEPSIRSFGKAGFRLSCEHPEEWWLELPLISA